LPAALTSTSTFRLDSSSGTINLAVPTGSLSVCDAAGLRKANFRPAGQSAADEQLHVRRHRAEHHGVEDESSPPFSVDVAIRHAGFYVG
jgi:hypothetical protein